MGGRRGRLTIAADRITAINLIQEACDAGCRKEKACEVLEIDIRTLQRWQRVHDHLDKRNGPITRPANKLTDKERARILEIATSQEYCNLPPCQIVPKLADKKIYIGSESSFYRILKEEKMLQHRTAARPRTHHKPDELVASKPNQIWSWDITYLRSNICGKFFYLYLFLDVFSRKIVGFNVFHEESSIHASEAVMQAFSAEGLKAGDVFLHSDNGSPMKGSTMLVTLQKLGIIPSFSRPSVSDDNPFSEALFRTLKYCPQYPSKPFASIDEAIAWVTEFVHWYNNIHQHSGINFVTPNERHQGIDKSILDNRINVYEAARQKNPNRWSRQIRNWQVAEHVYLNPKHSNKKAA